FEHSHPFFDDGFERSRLVVDRHHDREDRRHERCALAIAKAAAVQIRVQPMPMVKPFTGRAAMGDPTNDGTTHAGASAMNGFALSYRTHQYSVSMRARMRVVNAPALIGVCSFAHMQQAPRSSVTTRI